MFFQKWFDKEKKSSQHPINKKTQLLYDNYISNKAPGAKSLYSETSFVAVDFETTELNSKKNEIISMGFCPIKQNTIQLSNCLHVTIKPTDNLESDNVVIHKLTDDILSSGVSPEVAFQIFLKQTKNKVIVAHHHKIEKTFIQALSKKLFKTAIPVIFVDTLTLARNPTKHREQTVSPNTFRLFNLRKKYGLPDYNAHNSLEDAISTAELFIAQISDLNLSAEKITLKDLSYFRV